MEDNLIVGKITFYDSGEEMKYNSSESYLNALRNELDSNVGGFKYETLLREPKLLKEVDDFIYGAYGEKNPSLLDSYKERLLQEIEIIGGEVKDISSGAIRNPESLKQYDPNKQNKAKNNINNQTPKIMETQKEFDQVQYLKDQLKYLGFGEDEKLQKDLEKGIKSTKTQFEIKTSSDKALPENKVGFLLRFNKTDSGGVFLNSYHAMLKNEKDESIHHNFQVNRENTFTAKEAVNLLEGRAVKIEFQNPKTEQKEPAFVQFNFNEPKTENGNYNFQNFYKNYGVDTAQIVEKSNLIFDKQEWKENTIKSLEKGNIVKVKFEIDDKVIEGKAALNPQYKNLSLYDQDMNRINTNKPLEGLEQDNKHEKNNVKEQSIKR